MSHRGCKHLIRYISEHLQEFNILHACLIACTSEQALKVKAQYSICCKCNVRSWRLHACLFCTHIACYDNKHIHEHADNTDHCLAADLNYGYIYCFTCQDYKHDSQIEQIMKKHRRIYAKLLDIRQPYYSWEPTSQELELLKQNPKRKRISEDSHLGLRGLMNFGQTCFMNCVIQVLVHMPLLRDHFLSDRHICQFNENSSICFVCQISTIFQEVYSGESAAFIPSQLQFMVWTKFKNLSENKPHDAHEFFLSIRNILSEQCTSQAPMPGNHLNKNNIIQQIFCGEYFIDVVCLMCKNVSRTSEIFMDVSLDLLTNKDPQQADSNHVREDESLSLEDCLLRYISPEQVHGDCKVFCTHCKKQQLVAYQLTFRNLPIVMCCHLKRFEKMLDTTKKNSKYVSFPEVLDMTPFMYYSQQDSGLEETELPNSIKNVDNRYNLFAVIDHEGLINRGHYTAYINLCKNQWFNCDDHTICKVDITEVLRSNAYLLFYHKKILEYD